jgi:hypothetical protein
MQSPYSLRGKELIMAVEKAKPVFIVISNKNRTLFLMKLSYSRQ